MPNRTWCPLLKLPCCLVSKVESILYCCLSSFKNLLATVGLFDLNQSVGTPSEIESSVPKSVARRVRCCYITDGQASRATIPVLLHVFNGEDLNWYGPFDQVGQNKRAEDKLTDVLNELN